jgi:hypothetical protein
MDYFVRRGEDQFGPYSLAEMQEYAQAGRILPTDLAKSEGLPDWVPVTQILGNIPAAQPVPVSVGAAPVETVPLPPNLHWAVLVLITIVGLFLGLLLFLFYWVWVMILANWARRLSNNNKAIVLVAMYPAGFVAGVFAIVFGSAMNSPARTPWIISIGGSLIIGGAISYLIGIFKIREAMEDYYNSKENIALTLSGVMTFFFSIIYLQYHINRIHRWKQTGILS